MYNINFVQSAITILTHFESTNKYEITLRAHFTHAYCVLDTLPNTIINSWFNYGHKKLDNKVKIISSLA